jgi:hypothetical protein
MLDTVDMHACRKSTKPELADSCEVHPSLLLAAYRTLVVPSLRRAGWRGNTSTISRL